MSLLSHLTALEQSLHQPRIRADRAAVSDLLADDFREFGSSGRIWTREATLDLLFSEQPYTITARDFACQQLSPSLALLTYVSSNGQREALRSSLWRLEGDAWRMVFHQGTPIP